MIIEWWRYKIYEAQKILFYGQINWIQNYMIPKIGDDHKISSISQKFTSSHVFRNLNFNKSFNPSIYGDAFEKNIFIWIWIA